MDWLNRGEVEPVKFLRLWILEGPLQPLAFCSVCCGIEARALADSLAQMLEV